MQVFSVIHHLSCTKKKPFYPPGAYGVAKSPFVVYLDSLGDGERPPISSLVAKFLRQSLFARKPLVKG